MAEPTYRIGKVNHPILGKRTRYGCRLCRFDTTNQADMRAHVKDRHDQPDPEPDPEPEQDPEPDTDTGDDLDQEG